MKFEIQNTSIQDLVVIRRLRTEDNRGFFSRFYCDVDLKSVGFVKSIRQMNHTLTKKMGAFRGLHFQRPPFAEMKMVSCLKGKILDIAVDLRAGSPTFMKFHTEILSGDNAKSLLIPEGFAHGFQTLTPDCELLYLHTESYQPSAEGGLNVLDPGLGIALPLEITEISARDTEHPFIDSSFEGIII